MENVVIPNRVLAPFDGREASVAALRFACRIAPLAGLHLEIVRIATERHIDLVAEQAASGDREAAFRFISRRAEASLEVVGIEPAMEIRTLAAETVSGGVLQLIRDEEIRLIVLRAGGKPGSPRRDLASSLRCISDCDALFVGGHTTLPWSGGGVVIAVDGHPSCPTTVDRGLMICRLFERPAVFLHVVEPDGTPLQRASAGLDAALSSAAGQSVEARVEVVSADSIENGIISVLIDTDADLAVLRRGRRTVWGSVADRVVRQSCHDVYVVDGGREDA